MIKIYLFLDSFCVCRFYSSGVNFIVYLITSLALIQGSIERTLFLFLLLLFIYLYLFICDVYTGYSIQQRWFKRRPVYILALYTQFTHFIQLTY